MGVKTDRTKENVRKMPSEKKVPGWFSRLWFCWMFPAFYQGTRRDLDECDLQPTKKKYNSKLAGDKLEQNWLAEEIAAKAAGKKPSFTRVLIRTFGWSYVPCGIIQFLAVALRTLSPLLFAELLTYWSVNSTIDQTTAAYYGGAMIITNWFSAFFSHHGNLIAQQFGMKLRIATSSLMFRKIMRMNNGSLGETTAGKVVNILSNDLQRFDLAFLFMHYTWIIPIQLAAVLYLGYLQAKSAALIGFAALIIIALPIQAVLGRVQGKLRFRVADKTDERIKVMSEVINGIQVIKMYAWEIPFQKMVSAKRKAELRWVKMATLIRTVFLGFMLFTERTALFIAILTYVLLGNSLSANVIYPLQQFMSAAQINITLILPLVISFTSELIVSLRRVQEFLDLDDRPDLLTKFISPTTNNLFKNMASGDINPDTDVIKSVRPLSYQPMFDSAPVFMDNGASKQSFKKGFLRSISLNESAAVEVRDVSASWTNDRNFLALKNLSLRIRKGKLFAVIGAVGSGKSSLLQLLLKELPTMSGSISIDGELSYACQEAWLFPSTVRDNILFGLPYDQKKYNKVCRVSALEKDFKQFPYGDQTLVGERGVSLSGGQRARINLARAVYREADIYLLDDPLSAVDANVGRQLFEGCINGYLRGCTRILVTHQIHFLKAADYIIVMNEGSVENMGTFDELIKTEKAFATMLAQMQEGKDKDSDSLSSNESGDKKAAPMRLLSIAGEDEEMEQFEKQTMMAEERQSGNLKWEVISGYFKSGGSWCFILFTVFMILLTAASAAGADYWVSYWVNQVAVYEESLDGAEMDPSLDVQVGLFTTGQYLIIHGCIVSSIIILTQLRAIPFVKLCVSASKNLHNSMFANMIKGIMRFFDTSSTGRILNRFTKDMGALDEILPRTLLDVLQIYSTLTCIIILNAISLYVTVIPSAVLLILFFLFVKVYLKTAQGIKRLEGTTKSPVFSMVTSSLNGMATIRSCGAQDRLVRNFDDHQDLHTAAWNGFLCGGATFALYLDTMCLIYLATVIYVFLYFDFGDLIGVGSVGLAVTQSNMLTAMLQHGARMLVEFIAQLTSVERVLEYTRIENEPNLFEGQIQTPPTWPSQGRIVFQDVNLRYAPDEAPVLKNLNINIESGWKVCNLSNVVRSAAEKSDPPYYLVGIVGRTGAGKSSLISALFRFAYIDGNITIDGIETSLVSRQGLRSKISIIPQEPVLFSATMRYNLDPFNVYSDDDLWRALEQVDMKSAVPSLDFKVTEGGANFSVGQRQLLCLARAVLRSNKVLIMDEATANVDPSTDNFIQQTIRRQFAECTVLTIAHRLNTIMDSDRVLVMSFGQVAEFDHPYILLSDPNSALSSMVRETGEKNSAMLFAVAKDAYFKSNLKEHGQKLN